MYIRVSSQATMGNSGSLPEKVGGQVQKATRKLQRKVRGKKAVVGVVGARFVKSSDERQASFEN
jgi:hypothetical protein